MARGKSKTGALATWTMATCDAEIRIDSTSGRIELQADDGSGPGGGSAILTPAQARQVARQLADAADVVEEGGR